MSNKVVQLENESGDNLYPIAGGALTGSISKTMLEEGIFEGTELSQPSNVAYVANVNIQDGAVTAAKIASGVIPTVNNATLTIQKNGTNVATFTANSSTNATANITVPTITLSTTDIGEGATLAANTLYGVYS